MPLTLRFHDEELGSYLLEPDAPAPVDILAHPLTYFMRTREETTVICPTRLAPKKYLKAERGWIAIEFVGPFAFNEIGIMTQVANPLAAAAISILALATFGTDYILIKADKRDKAVAALRQAGHKVLAA